MRYRFARWLESRAFAATPERIGVWEGLRAATIVSVMVVAALWVHWPLLSWAAFGAFWVCLADPGGPDAGRLRASGGFAIGGTLVAWAAATAAGWGPLAAGSALLPLVFLASLSRAYGPAAAQSGMLVCVVAVVAVAFPRSPLSALTLAAVFLLGSVWALVLCLVVWRTHPHAPARRAIASVFDRLGDMSAGFLARRERTARSEAADWPAFNAVHRRSVRDAIERARGLVTSLENGQERYRAELAQADRIFAGLIAIGHPLEEHVQPVDDTDRHLLKHLRLLLIEAGLQAARRTPDGGYLYGQACALAAVSSQRDTLLGRGVTASALALHDLALRWVQGAGPVLHAAAAPRQPPPEILRPIPKTVLRHAARLAVAVVVAYAITVWLGLPFSYWATMATVVVLQPFATTTWPRGIERMLGSVSGGLLAAAITVLLPSKFGLLAAIFPIAAATIAFRLVNYTLFVFFLTPLFVLVSELLQPGSGIAAARAINNVIGTLVGVGASYFLWPDHDALTMEDILANAVTANFAYAAGVVGAPERTPETLDELRRKAGLASNAAETARHRIILQGRRRRAHLDQMGKLLEALRALAGAAIARSLSGRQPDAPQAAYFPQLSVALVRTLRQPSSAPALPAAPHGTDELSLAAGEVIITLAAYVSDRSPAEDPVVGPPLPSGQKSFARPDS